MIAEVANVLANYSADEIALTRDICKDSFFSFMQEMWPTIIQEVPVWNWHIELLCNEMQAAAELVFAGKDREWDYIFNMPPGTTKSTIVSVMFPAWTWAKMPSARHICASHTDQLVLDLSRKCRSVVRSELYQACFPEVQISEDQDTKGYFTTTKGGMRLCATVGGKNPMGFHAHFINVDDPIDPNQVMSEAALKSANLFMTNTVPSRKVDKRTTVTFLTMQRLHQNDPTGDWLSRERDKIKWFKMPGEVRLVDVIDESQLKPGAIKEVSEEVQYKKEWNCQPEELRHNYVDGLLDPVRLPLYVLEEYKAKGRFFYSGQFDQDPVPLGGGMFNVAKLHIKVLDTSLKFKKLVRYWDKAGTEDDGAHTAGVLMGLASDNSYWVLDVVRGQWEAYARETVIKTTARMDGLTVRIAVEQEGGSGGKESAQSTVKRLAGFRVCKDLPRGDKVLRADPYSYQVNAGNVWLARANWNRAYIDEMKFFPKSKFKDQIDASSGAFAQLTKSNTVGAVA